MRKEVADLVKSLSSLEEHLESSGDSLECQIKTGVGDWGGQHILVSLSPWSAAHIARQLVQLIERDVDGAHFDIDKASIASETDNQLCFSLTKAGK